MILPNRLITLITLALSTSVACHSRDENPDAAEHQEHHEEHAPHSGHDDDAIVQLDPKAAAHVSIRTAPVEERALSGMLSTTGRVDFNQDRLAHVAPRVPGRVHRVQATLGDDVKPGQTLAIIDSIELGRAKSAFLRAKVQVDLAQTTLDREQGLLEDKITSEQSVLEARSAFERARAAFQSARQELRLLGLSDRQIEATSADDPTAALFPLSSPLAGTVVDKHVSLGEVVSPNDNLFTVADLSTVWIWIDVYERDLAHVHLEDDVAVKVDAYPERPFQGKVGYIRDQVDPDTRTARARIDVPNPNGRLRPGMFATITVTDPHGVGGDAAPRTLVVPADAIQRDGSAQVVFVADGDHRYERRSVEVGRRTDDFVEIVAGLSARESVVVEGTFILKSEAAKHRMGGGHSH